MKYTIISCFLFGLFATTAHGLIKAGDFQNYAHGIGGEVMIQDEKTIIIKGFTYDGAGPDAFFWAGTSGKPSHVGTILPWPFKGQFYEYEDSNAPILSKRFNGDEITLTLPDHLKTTDLKWLSVWCRAFRVNFGDMFFPEDLKLEETVVEEEDDDVEPLPENAGIPEELPPPLVEPVQPINAHDPHHRDEDWKDDSDAYSLPEAESESESAHGEPGSANIHHVSLATLIMIISVYIF